METAPETTTNPGRWRILCGNLLLLVTVAAFLIQLRIFVGAFSKIAESETSPKPSDLAIEISESMIWSEMSMWALGSGLVLLVIGLGRRSQGRRRIRKRMADAEITG